MADIALATANKVNVVTLPEFQHTFVAGEAIVAGSPVYVKSSDGKAYNADGNGITSAWGVATRTVSVAGQPITAIRRGVMDGFDLSALNYGDAVWLSDTVGRLSTTAASADIKIGYVLPAYAVNVGAAPDKVLHVEVVAPGYAS